MCQAGSGWAARRPICKKREVGRPGSFPKQLQGLTVGEAGGRLVEGEKEEKAARRRLLAAISCLNQTRWKDGERSAGIETGSRTCKLMEKVYVWLNIISKSAKCLHHFKDSNLVTSLILLRHWQMIDQL